VQTGRHVRFIHCIGEQVYKDYTEDIFLAPRTALKLCLVSAQTGICFRTTCTPPVVIRPVSNLNWSTCLMANLRYFQVPWESLQTTSCTFNLKLESSDELLWAVSIYLCFFVLCFKSVVYGSKKHRSPRRLADFLISLINNFWGFYSHSEDWGCS
jgi:hypothetical protein